MKPKKISIAIVLAAATLLAQGQKPGSPAPHSALGTLWNAEPLSLSKPVERVNGTTLTERDVVREMYAIFPYARQHNGFPKAMEAEIRKGALMMITFEELVYQEAQRRKMTIAPERLTKAESQLRQQFGSPKQFQDFLDADASGSRQVLRQRIRRSLLIDDLLKAEVTNKSVVTLAEAQAFYRNNEKKFLVPEQYTLQTITIMPPAPANPKQATPVQPTAEQLKQMQTRADAALQQAKATKTSEEFGLLAEKISEDDYRVMMGSHHPLPPDQLPPAIVKAVSTLQVGQISGLIQAEGAYTIVRLNAHSQARKQKFEEVSKALRTQMQKQKSEQLRHALDERLRKNAKIEQL